MKATVKECQHKTLNLLDKLDKTQTSPLRRSWVLIKRMCAVCIEMVCESKNYFFEASTSESMKKNSVPGKKNNSNDYIFHHNFIY